MTDEAITLPDGAVLQIALAQPADLETVADIDAETARWARESGFDPGQPPPNLRELFGEVIAEGRMYLGQVEGQPAAKIALSTAEESLWADLPGDALYVHGLAVRRAFAGRQIGLAMLGWAGDHARTLGKPLLRLDCMADNPALRAYYERAGFTHRGDVTLPTRGAARYERVILDGSEM